ncbi:hypothetical protein GB931_16930 [Modestobacter sp. I12A-02628]|uniref:hypothetical protein n=1 Tax=Goekera deserti TaxID=2497753 RepID=UPI00141CA85B|nr:hypothetical protein [Goekera deserti]MPQ99570.1 hypothetical protein [Goekera deserti]
MVERRESTTGGRVTVVSSVPSGKQLAAQHIEAERASPKTSTHARPPEQGDQLHRAPTDILAGGVLRPPTDQEHRL